MLQQKAQQEHSILELFPRQSAPTLTSVSVPFKFEQKRGLISPNMSKFSWKWNSVRGTADISEGKVPERLFAARKSSSRLWSRPNSVGMVPVRALPAERERERRKSILATGTAGDANDGQRRSQSYLLPEKNHRFSRFPSSEGRVPDSELLPVQCSDDKRGC